MSRENHIVNALAYESEKIDGKKKVPVRALARSLEVTGWDNDVDFFQFFEMTTKAKNPSRKESLSPSFDAKVVMKKDLRSKNSPLIYKISTISLEDSHQSRKCRAELVDHFRLARSKKKFSSVYFPHKRRVLYKSDGKRNSVPEISSLLHSNLLHLLKPETKNPVRALIVPQLKSRTELYRSFSKSRSKKKLDFFFINNLSPEPKKCQMKLLK